MPRMSARPPAAHKRSAHDDTDLLTFSAAADYLNVDESFLRRLLDEGALIARSSGDERVIPRAEIVAYRRRRDAERRAHLEALSRLSEEAGMDDVDYAAIIARTP